MNNGYVHFLNTDNGKMRKCIFNGKVQGKKFAHIICIQGDTDYVVPTPAQWVVC